MNKDDLVEPDSSKLANADVDASADNIDSDTTKSLLDRLDGDAESFQAALIQSFTEFEKDFKRRYPWFWLMALVGPLVATLALLGCIGLFGSWSEVLDYLTAAAWTFFIYGRFAIAGASIGIVLVPSQEFTPLQAFWMLMYMDVMVALFVSFHMGLLFRIPFIGPKVGALVYDGKFILERHPWMKRVAFFGLVTFVVFPASTTGSIGGSIFGRLVGLSRMWTLGAIALGSLIGNGIMLWLGELIGQYVDHESVTLKIVGILIVVAIVFGIEFRFRKLKKQYLASKQSPQET